LDIFLIVNASGILFAATLILGVVLLFVRQLGFEWNLWASGLLVWLCGPGFFVGAVLAATGVVTSPEKKPRAVRYLVLNLGGLVAVLAFVASVGR